MKRSLQFAAWLLLAVSIIPLGSCANLSVPPGPAQPAAAQSLPTPEAPTPEAQVAVVIEVAPTPTAAALKVIATPTAIPTVAPRVPAATKPHSLANCDSSSRLVRSKWPSTVYGQPREYAVYLPPCYADNPDQRYPVIYLFHGWPMDENHWLDLGIVRAADELINSGELPPFIIALPRGDKEGVYNRTSGGDKSWEGAMINEFIPYIDKTYRTRAQRDYRAIGGISRGAVWSLEIGLRHPDVFASVGGHSPALSVNRATADYDPLDIANDAPIETLRIFLDAGDKDWTRDSARELSKLLEARHVPHTYTIGKGDHTDAYWTTQVPAYLKFYAAPWKAEQLVQDQLQTVAQ